ncbi:MAG: hypothetical protein ACI4SV_02090 [Duodenibacillus sp.]
MKPSCEAIKRASVGSVQIWLGKNPPSDQDVNSSIGREWAWAFVGNEDNIGTMDFSFCTNRDVAISYDADDKRQARRASEIAKALCRMNPVQKPRHLHFSMGGKLWCVPGCDMSKAKAY